MYFAVINKEEGNTLSELRIWVKEPQDNNPFPVHIQTSWVVADLAICLAKHPEFNLESRI